MAVIHVKYKSKGKKISGIIKSVSLRLKLGVIIHTVFPFWLKILQRRMYIHFKKSRFDTEIDAIR